MPSAAVQPLCNIYLFGPLAVTDAKDCGHTPRSQKSRALIAMLALSPRGSRSRVWLRDKLWSDRAEEQASASLRQALVEIRKALGPAADNLIHADKHTISLDLGRVRIDALEVLEAVDKPDGRARLLSNAAQSEFLEGLDVRDPEFEEWLTLERQVWRDRLERASVRRYFTPKEGRGAGFARAASNNRRGGAASRNNNGNRKTAVGPAGFPGWSVAVLPPKILGEPSTAAHLCDFFTDVLVKSLLEAGDISVSDYSRRDFVSDLLERSVFETPALALQVRHSFSDRQINSTLSLHRTADHALLWIGSSALDRSAVEARDTSGAQLLVNEATAEVREHFARGASPEQLASADESLSSVVNAISRLSRADLAASEETLRRHIELRPSSQAHAWLAFLMALRIGPRFESSASAYEQARQDSRGALELDNNNHAVSSSGMSFRSSSASMISRPARWSDRSASTQRNR